LPASTKTESLLLAAAICQKGTGTGSGSREKGLFHTGFVVVLKLK
jgi:hypothetical protein